MDLIEPHPRRNAATRASPPKRPWLAVHFRCCHAYGRLYRNRRSDAYEGACPRCGKRLEVPIGPGGTSNRFFTAE